jgi:hypothetical protein
MDAQEPTDLERVDEAIRQAHDARDRLVELSPGSIRSDEEQAAEGGGDERAAEGGDDERPTEGGGDATSRAAGGPGAPSDEPG